MYTHDSHACGVAMKETLFYNKGRIVQKISAHFVMGCFLIVA